MKLFGPCLLILGAILNLLALFMLLPVGFSLAYESANQIAFVISATFTSVIGIIFLVIGKKYPMEQMQPKQVFLITSFAWVGVSAFSALPFVLMHNPLNLASAFFEAVSGITTTGSSAMVGIEHYPKDILLWRSLLNWIGGVGIIGMAIAVLPFLRVGGMRLFKTESSDWSDKALPRAQSLMAMIIYAYLFLSVACFLSYWIAGMDWFNAVNHAMTTVATGGFSTTDSSFAQFDSLAIHWIAIIFMIAGAAPFVLFVRLMVHKKFLFLRDTQVRGLLTVIGVTTLVITIHLIANNQMDPLRAITMACFNLVSIITTTGFASGDYQTWGQLAWVVFFFCMFIGGCSGSTSGGIKIFRFQIFSGLVKEQLITAIHPKAIISRRYNNKLISSEILSSSVAYMFLFVMCFGALSFILALTGLDFVTCVTGAATALMNVGPGMGDVIGPAGNFASLPDAAKWSLSAGMLLGRLEFLTLVVLFSSVFWRS
jgi:trk system potassium uptake protein TrkH